VRHAIAILKQKYEALSPYMDECIRRLWAATEAQALGWGGVTAVSAATGLSRTTITAGLIETQRRAPGEAETFTTSRLGDWVSVGTDPDTAEFAVATIRQWWRQMGRHTYPHVQTLLVIASAGGSNGWRTRLWEAELQRLANALGLTIAVCHLPPGTSKWNKSEHRWNYKILPKEPVNWPSYFCTITYLCAFVDCLDAEDHNRYFPAQRPALPYPARGCDELGGQPAQAQQNQVGGSRKARTTNRIQFVSGRVYPVAVRLEQLPYPIAGFLNILHHKDDRAAAIFFAHIPWYLICTVLQSAE
jgi:hypothetical protein